MRLPVDFCHPALRLLVFFRRPTLLIPECHANSGVTKHLTYEHGSLDLAVKIISTSASRRSCASIVDVRFGEVGADDEDGISGDSTCDDDDEISGPDES